MVLWVVEWADHEDGWDFFLDSVWVDEEDAHAVATEGYHPDWLERKYDEDTQTSYYWDVESQMNHARVRPIIVKGVVGG